MQHYRHARKPVMQAPFPLSVYREFLHTLHKNPKNHFERFDADTAPGASCVWYVRHDMDTPSCPGMVPKLFDADAQFGIVSAAFLRVGGEAYALRDVRGVVSEYRARGFLFGLHSECYLHDDWWQALKKEIVAFQDILGFSPHGLNAHGYGTFRLPQRQEFYRGIDRDRLQELGIPPSDLHTGLRDYDYTVEDSHAVGPAKGLNDFSPARRRLLTDILTPPAPRPRTRRLFLTHPGYWQ